MEHPLICELCQQWLKVSRQGASHTSDGSQKSWKWRVSELIHRLRRNLYTNPFQCSLVQSGTHTSRHGTNRILYYSIRLDYKMTQRGAWKSFNSSYRREELGQSKPLLGTGSDFQSSAFLDFKPTHIYQMPTMCKAQFQALSGEFQDTKLSLCLGLRTLQSGRRYGNGRKK